MILCLRHLLTKIPLLINRTGLVFYFLLTATFFLNAQSKSYTDSLVKLIDSRKLVDDHQRLEVMTDIAYYHYQPENALFYSEAALDLAFKLESDLNIAKAFESIGFNQRILGNYEVSVNASYEAFRIYQRLNLKRMQASLSSQIAECLTEQGLYDQAIFEFKKAVLLFDSLSLRQKKVGLLLNLGEAYRLSLDLKNAEKYFNEAILLNQQFNFRIVDAYALGNLGITHHAQGKLPEALQELKEAMAILTELDDPSAMVIYDAEIGQIEIKMGQKQAGFRRIENAFNVAKNHHIKAQIRDLSQLLSDRYADEGDFSQAYHYQKEFQIYQDSLVNAESIRKIEQTKSRYELDKKNDEIALAEVELSKKKTETMFYTVSTFLLLVLFTILFFAYRSKKRTSLALTQKNKIISLQAEEKEMLHREMHHRIKNNLHLISSVMGLQSQSAKNPEVSDELTTGRSRMEAMTLIHKSLYREERINQVNLQEYLEQLTENLKATFSGQIGEISVHVLDGNIQADDSIPFGLIVNEAICNAVKHKLADQINIAIQFFHYEEGYLLSIEDDGAGVGESGVRQEGFGTKLIHTLARQLRGELDIKSSSSGTTITLKLSKLKLEPNNAETKKPT